MSPRSDFPPRRSILRQPSWTALFMVGCLLFILSLGINYGAQKIVRRYRLPQS